MRPLEVFCARLLRGLRFSLRIPSVPFEALIHAIAPSVVQDGDWHAPLGKEAIVFGAIFIPVDLQSSHPRPEVAVELSQHAIAIRRNV